MFIENSQQQNLPCYGCSGSTVEQFFYADNRTGGHASVYVQGYYLKHYIIGQRF